jgi:hypothetical protein
VECIFPGRLNFWLEAVKEYRKYAIKIVAYRRFSAGAIQMAL